MPLYNSFEPSPSFKAGIWHITETLSELQQHFPSPLLQPQQIATRLLLNHLCNQNVHQHICYDSFGKPFLPDNSWQLSLSHTKNNWAAAIVSTHAQPGIDIEPINSRILRLSHKFLSSAEQNLPLHLNPTQHAHFVWGAKEVLYKIYGKKELNFLQNLSITIAENTIIGTISKNDYLSSHRLDFQIIENMMLVYTV